MANIEKDIAGEILRAGGLSASRLGLRFDRVVVGVLGELRAFADTAAPAGVAIVVTISAPIRLPAKTVVAVKRELVALLSEDGPRLDRVASCHGNAVSIRLVDAASDRPLRLVGFVHNPDSPPEALLDLAEHWLRG